MQIILPLLVHCFVCIFVNYALDRPSFPNQRKEVSMPSVRDLPADSGIYEIDKYVTQVILPAYDYFSESKAAEPPTDGFLHSLILYGSSFLYVSHSLFINLSEIDFFNNNRFFHALSAIVISLTICLSFGWILQKVYKKWFAIGVFSLTPDQVVDFIPKYYEGLNISEERYIQNYSIHIYHDYIKSNRGKTERRCFASKLMSFVAGTIYLLFFFNPDRYT